MPSSTDSNEKERFQKQSPEPPQTATEPARERTQAELAEASAKSTAQWLSNLPEDFQVKY